MPTYDFRCRSCNSVTEECAPSGQVTIECPACGAVADRMFNTRVQFYVPAYMRADADRLNPGRHRRYMESPEVQAKLKSGEWSVEQRPKTPFPE